MCACILVTELLTYLCESSNHGNQPLRKKLGGKAAKPLRPLDIVNKDPVHGAQPYLNLLHISKRKHVNISTFSFLYSIFKVLNKPLAFKGGPP